jgi:TRAP-type mannitol/chloroaromatic compound transport system permease large subunit
VYAVMSNDVLVAVPLFVFMGVMLERSNIAAELLDAVGRLFGTVPGGIGYSVILVGALLAASTGIVGATVVTMGLLSLPAMLRRGYDPALACGSVCAAGTLGQIIPPSILLILLADQISAAWQKAQYDAGNFAPDAVSVNDFFAGALVPGLVLVVLYLFYQAATAILRPHRSPAVEADRDASPAAPIHVVSVLLAPLALIVAVLGSILAGLASPTEAASIGAVGALLLAGGRGAGPLRPLIGAGAACFAGLLILSQAFDLRLLHAASEPRDRAAVLVALVLAAGLLVALAAAMLRLHRVLDDHGRRVLVEVLTQTLTVTSMVFAIVIGAAMFSLVLRGFGGDRLIEELLSALPGGAATAVAVVMLTMFLLGFVLEFLEIIYIVVPIVAPVLLSMEVAPGVAMDPVWLGIMIAVNLQTSFLTPPFGLSLFYLRGVAPVTVRTGQIYRGVIPFVAIQLLTLVLLWHLPRLTTWLPAVLSGR